MAYGGSAVAPTAPPGSSETVRHVKLDKECELRIEVGPDFPLRLRLVSGTAEISGTEIRLSFPPGHKFAVFTWYGATIEIDGSTETDYTADEGPRVIVVGPTDSRKSTLSRMLLSWAAKPTTVLHCTGNPLRIAKAPRLGHRPAAALPPPPFGSTHCIV